MSSNNRDKDSNKGSSMKILIYDEFRPPNRNESRNLWMSRAEKETRKKILDHHTIDVTKTEVIQHRLITARYIT
jgi:hypothetical protein